MSGEVKWIKEEQVMGNHADRELGRAMKAGRAFDFSLITFHAIIHSANDEEYFLKLL